MKNDNLKFKNLFSCFVFLLSLFFLSGCAFFNSVTYPSIPHLTRPAVSSELRVFFLDVGQGDAELVITPKGKIILIDGGPGDNILSKLGEALPVGQKKIDTMILTHPHADHLEGLIPVLRRYKVGEVYYTGVTHTTDEFLIWLNLIKEKSIPMRLVDKQFAVEYEEGVKLDFLYPDRNLSMTGAIHGSPLSSDEIQESKSQKGNNLNNTSIVFKLSFGRTSFLFMGDAETPVEKELLSKVEVAVPDPSLQSTVLKIAHHGSRSSTSENFLKTVAPRVAVIEVGKDNDFGHPHLIILRRLERQGARIYRTDQDRTVQLVSDGERVERR